jgi:sugar lactone lactonase YvrE
VRAYPVQDDGALGAGRRVYEAPEGGLDGLCLDAQDNLIVCAADVRVISPDGRLLESHAAPDGRPAACAFGGPDLFVSTQEGHLYRVRNTRGDANPPKPGSLDC